MSYKEIEEGQKYIKGDDAMRNHIMPYTTLDLHFLMEKNVKVVSSNNALQDVKPIAWEEDVLQGKQKIQVVKKKNGSK